MNIKCIDSVEHLEQGWHRLRAVDVALINSVGSRATPCISLLLSKRVVSLNLSFPVVKWVL